MNISKVSRKIIYKILVKEWVRIIKTQEDIQSINLLNEIWDLHNMESGDNRFTDAYGDIFQHYFNNSDWETEYLFEERLSIYNDTTDFQKFIEVLLQPQFYENDECLLSISNIIDIELENEELKLIIEDYDDSGLPIQKIYKKEEDKELPNGVKKNNIPIYVIKNGKEIISEKPYFTLYPDKNWNDYSVISIFTLFYNSDKIRSEIGLLKIIHKKEIVTWGVIPDMFYQLTKEFCSLSVNEQYYFNLQSRFKNYGMISILFALQDTAYFNDISDRFENNYNFKNSLIRYDSTERLLREIKPKLQGRDLKDLYSFSYKFHPLYSDFHIKVSFDFNNTGDLPNRIIAVIGKNGAGKTQLMTGLPNSLGSNNIESFYNKPPVFSKIIAVSYSYFDNSIIPRKNATFNYIYCGLQDKNGDARAPKGLAISFHYNWKRIVTLGRTKKWKSILINFIDSKILDSFFVRNANTESEFEISLEGFSKNRRQLSSGQSIQLYIFTQIIANIRFDSLLLYDEPETHLHPNAIVELMSTIYELVEEFQSYCLIATHSPLVIRELLSKNVYVMDRNENQPFIRRIGIESFGENIGILSDEVFGDREVSKHYKKVIERLVNQGKKFDEIVAMLEFDEVPLSLNTRIMIKNLTRN